MKQLGLTYAAGTAMDSKAGEVSLERLNKCRTMLTMPAMLIAHACGARKVREFLRGHFLRKLMQQIWPIVSQKNITVVRRRPGQNRVTW
jgi:hypothetical protein